jgi:hypothetical protein
MTADWLYAASAIAATVLLSFFVRWRRPSWSTLRLSLLAAAILPGLLLALGVLLFVGAAFSSPEACGIDACGMAMLASMYMAVGAGVLWLVGALATFGLHFLLRRR